MAEVKQVSGSFSLSSSKKKPPSFSNNGVSSSFKHIYDDVFGGSSPNKQKSSSNYMEDDYAEVFGSSKSNNGCWSIPYSSIPIIDLPKGKDKDKNFASSRKGGERMDYSGVFGGIDDDSFGLPNGEELFDHLKKKARTLPRIQRHAPKTANPGISSKSCEQLPTNGFCQSFDNTKHFELGNNEMTTNSNKSRPRKAAHVRAYSMHEVSATQNTLSSQTPLIKDDEKSPPNGFCQSSDHPNHSELGDREMAMNANSGPIKAAHVHANSLHEVSATQKTLSSHTHVVKDDGKSPTNGVCQSSDSRNHFESGDCEMLVNASSEPRTAAHSRGYSLHEVSDTHNSLSSQTPVIKDDEISLTIGFCQSSDNTKYFEPGDSEMAVNAKSGPRKAAHVRAYSLHEVGATQKSLPSQTPEIKYDEKSPTNGFCRSSDSMKHFELGDSEMEVNAKGEPRKAAHVRAYSLHEVSDTQKSFNSRTPAIKDEAVNVDSNFGKKQENHSRHISLDVSANKRDSDAGLQKVSGMSGSNSIDKSHGTCQPSKAATNEFCQSFSNTNDFEHNTNESKNAQISGATNAVEVQPIHEPNHTVHEVGPSQKILSSATSLRNNETQSHIDFNLAEDQGKQSYNTSLDGGADRQNSDCDASFQKACGQGESISVDGSHETCQVSFEASPSKVVKNNAEVAVGCGKVKKKGRRSRMSSLDLNDYKHSCEHDSGNLRKPRFGSSYSFDASNDPCAAHVQVQPSKMYPSSSLPRFFPVESHYKISDNSSFKSSQKNMYRGGVESPPSLAEELDVNSPAAVCAAALQRAIEEAEMRIRWAKSFLEREGQGSKNLRFKDTLKVTVAKENGLTNEINKFKQPKRDDSFSSVESDVQPCPPLERKHVTANTQVAPIFEDQNIFFKDGNFTEVTDAKASDWMREDEKCEGGEWEAAKHLNQIISGVKNKIASFMSWQTESEKKEDWKEIEPNMKHQQPSEEVEHHLKDHEVLEEKITEKNPGTTTTTTTTTTTSTITIHEDEVKFESDAVEPEENESIRGVNAKQEKVGNKVHVIPDTAEPSLANFQFFAFRNQRTCDPPVSDIKEKKGPLEIRESQIENDQAQVINEVNDEHLPFQSEVASPVELGDECVTQGWERQDDMCDGGSSDGENDKTTEEPNDLAGHNDMEHSHEEYIEDVMNSKGDDVCSTTEENIEMEEQLYSLTGHHHKEFTCKLVGQDDMGRKNHIGFINEENVEIVQEPYPLAGHNMKSFSAEEAGQDDLWKSNLVSNNKENDVIVEELYTHSGHERTNDVHEEDNDTCLDEEYEVKPLDHADHSVISSERTDKDDCGRLKEAEKQHMSLNINEDINVVAETRKDLEATEGVFSENERDEIKTNNIEEAPGQTYGWEENEPDQTDNVEETAEQVTVQATCVVSAEEGEQNQNVRQSKAEEASNFVESNSDIKAALYPDEVIESMIDITNSSFEPEIKMDCPVPDLIASELIREEPEVTPPSTESITKLVSNGMESCNGAMRIFQCETSSETVMSSEERDADVKMVEPQSQDNLENQADFFYESREMLHVEDYDTASDQEVETSGVEAVHRRRRWFDNRGSMATAERPSILEGNRTDLEMDQEVLDESELAGSVEIHADKVDCSAAEIATARDAEVSSNQGCSRTNVEITPKRRRWFVERGEEGIPEPLSLFEGVKVNLEVPHESNSETLLHKDNILDSCLDQLNTGSGESLNEMKPDVPINGGKGKQSGEAAPRRKRWFESRERVEPGQQVRIDGDVGLSVELDQEIKGKGDAEKLVKPVSMTIPQEMDDVHSKVESKEQQSNINEVNRKEKEREKEKLAVERAIREARERAFAEARERARRDAAERPNVETRQKVASGVQEKPGKVSSEGTSSSDKASVEAKLKAERAAVERATAEARERALQKSLSEKAFPRSKEQAGRYPTEKNSSLEPKFQSSRSSDGSNSSDKFEGVDVESAQRRKARLERQKRTTERAAKALEEKNRRDLVTQKEQAAKNMLADALDAEVRRWSTGKEGNLRALLSTLQYILGPDSGWQPVSLTDLVAATAVRKAYKKATLCVHPDKLQQRGASIQQKHICEKVFDLLKEAWSKFNPDER